MKNFPWWCWERKHDQHDPLGGPALVVCTGAVFSLFAKLRKNGVKHARGDVSKSTLSRRIRVSAMCKVTIFVKLCSVTLALASRDSPASLSPSIPWLKSSSDQ